MADLLRRATVRSVAVAGVVLAACSPGGGGDDALPPSPPVVEVEMADHRFEHPGRLAPGRTVIRAPNTGTVDHEMVLVGLPEDFPPLDEQLRGETRRGVRTLASMAPTAPGLTGTLAVDLTPGRYGLICYLKDSDGVEHFFKGMSSELRVG